MRCRKYRGEKASATIEGERLFLPIKPRGAVRPFPNNLESIILHNEGIFMRGRNPRQLPIILGADVKGNLTSVQSSSERKKILKYSPGLCLLKFMVVGKKPTQVKL